MTSSRERADLALSDPRPSSSLMSSIASRSYQIRRLTGTHTKGVWTKDVGYDKELKTITGAQPVGFPYVAREGGNRSRSQGGSVGRAHELWLDETSTYFLGVTDKMLRPLNSVVVYSYPLISLRIVLNTFIISGFCDTITNI